MGRYIKEILDYLKDSDNGLELGEKDSLLIYSDEPQSLIEIFEPYSKKIFVIMNNASKSDAQGNIFVVNTIDDIPVKTVDYALVNSNLKNIDLAYFRNGLKKVLVNYWSDLVLIEDENKYDSKTLHSLFGGSGYEVKEITKDDRNLKIFSNPPGFLENDLEAKEITEFIQACSNYCKILENYNNYSVKDFLYNTQKTLINYYLKGFDLPECSGSDGNTAISDKATKKDVNIFFELLNNLETFLGEHNTYWGNFSPYPDEKDKEVCTHSLSSDIAEIYEDIKGNLDGYTLGNLYDKQEMLWQFKFDWHGHTGDHWTFAVRAIHWKLQELEFED